MEVVVVAIGWWYICIYIYSDINWTELHDFGTNDLLLLFFVFWIVYSESAQQYCPRHGQACCVHGQLQLNPVSRVHGQRSYFL